MDDDIIKKTDVWFNGELNDGFGVEVDKEKITMKEIYMLRYKFVISFMAFLIMVVFGFVICITDWSY